MNLITYNAILFFSSNEISSHVSERIFFLCLHEFVRANYSTLLHQFCSRKSLELKSHLFIKFFFPALFVKC